ncbi:glycosyl hydrolase 2 galactose-binding domain-containing protein, partial [Klebsiella pneumoniae]|uniref:glycosyl hydrolase 2 galactose-binding domain-containing protein n=1 Tax=Klebsiella pneumoniae TaxID=573 RepID=UPI0025A282E1
FLGIVDGAFRTADFDVTGILRDGENDLAVQVVHNPSYGMIKEQTAYTPQSNGGVLGGDNPTMHASIGWDWIPTVRGRNIG